MSAVIDEKYYEMQTESASICNLHRHFQSPAQVSYLITIREAYYMCYLLFHELHELLGLYGAHLAVSPKLDAERKYRLTFGEYSKAI